MILLNASMMPSPDFIYKEKMVSKEQFINLLKQNDFKSYIGYPQTAEFLKKISGVEVLVCREKVSLNPDTDKSGKMLICKLIYRVKDPNTKGKEVDESDFEFYVANYYSTKYFRVITDLDDVPF